MVLVQVSAMKMKKTFLFLISLAQALSLQPSDLTNVTPRTRAAPVLEDSPQYPESRIVNGYQARRGQFPYQVALYLDGAWFCGGSLITPSVILSAAHCTIGISTITAHLGAQALNSLESGRIPISSRNAVNHEEYNPVNLNNDVSIVRLPAAIARTSFIHTVALPGVSQLGNTFVGQTATVSGWGRPSDTTTSISNQLNWVTLPIITNDECSSVYGASWVVNSTICASGAGGRGTCFGDSGGPLTVPINGVVTQIGIVSFVATAGCSAGYPSGYARTTSFVPWISSNAGIAIRP